VHDAACVEDPLHEDRGVVGDHVAQRKRAERVLVPHYRRLFLHRHREPIQWAHLVAAPRVPLLGCAGLGQRFVEKGLRKSVDLWFDGCAAIDDCLDQLDRR